MTMVDVAQLERTLDLWASMWEAEERAQFERALERVLDGDAALPLKLAALAACRVIATPRLLGAAEHAMTGLNIFYVEDVESVAEPRARLLRHAERLQHDRAGVLFLLEKAVRDPQNPVADHLLDRIDIRDLYAVMNLTFDDELRREAARRLARRGPHQRQRLIEALALPADAFDQALSVDISVDDLLTASG
jgi:hypothetical protein